MLSATSAESPKPPYFASTAVWLTLLFIAAAGGQELDPHVTSSTESIVDNQMIVQEFDGVQPTWQLPDHEDALHLVRTHRRSDLAPLRGRRCEYLSLVANQGGEQILCSHPLDRYAAIQELAVSLWLRGNREGFQIMARVRLPRELADGEPMAVTIYGDRYASPGFWQQLSVDDFPARVADAVRALQIELGRHLDAGEAYVDQVLVNAYGGAGLNRIWIDDLAAASAVSVQNSRKHSAPMLLGNLASSVGAASVQMQEDILSDDWLSKVITYNGEEFKLLKELGFNTVWLPSTATENQMQEAYSLGLKIICPPPVESSTQVGLRHRRFDGVSCWSIDTKSMSAHEVATRVRQLRSVDPLNRPIVARLSSLPPKAYGTADIVLADDADTQAEARHRWLVVSPQLISSSRWWPMRDAIWSGVTRGFGGYVVVSTKSLEADHRRHERNLTRLTNHELNTLRPWINRADVDRSTIGSSKNAGIKVDLLSDMHSSIALLRKDINQVNRFASQEITIPTGEHREVFRVEPGGLAPYTGNHRVAGGIRFLLDRNKPNGIYLLTDRKTIVENMTRYLRSIERNSTDTLTEVIRHEMVLLDRRLESPSVDEALRSHLRGELHQLHSRIAPLLALDANQSATFRELDHVLGQLERVYRTID